MFLNQAPLVACKNCDLLLERHVIPYGSRAACPRCGTDLYRPVKNSIERALVLAITGLILFLPANLEPMLSLTLLGITQEATIIKGVVSLFEANLIMVSGLVLTSAIIVPLLNLLLIFYVTSSLTLNIAFPHIAPVFRVYLHLLEWAMLEVYMLGIFVALVKLVDTADVVIGAGLYCFAGLLVVTVMISTHIDKVLFWEEIEMLNHDE